MKITGSIITFQAVQMLALGPSHLQAEGELKKTSLFSHKELQKLTGAPGPPCGPAAPGGPASPLRPGGPLSPFPPGSPFWPCRKIVAVYYGSKKCRGYHCDEKPIQILF